MISLQRFIINMFDMENKQTMLVLGVVTWTAVEGKSINPAEYNMGKTNWE